MLTLNNNNILNTLFQFSSNSFASHSTSTNIKKTKLNEFHKRHGGTMVPFCGWEMPVSYKGNKTTEVHKLTRTSATIFDVSHMGQLKIHGKDRYDFIESLVPGNIKDLKLNNARLTQFTNEKGGIIDDTIITKKDGYLFQVINAACTDSDLKHMREHLKQWKNKGKDVDIEHIKTHSLIAFQGPKAVNVLQKYAKNFDFSKQYFMSSHNIDIMGIPNIRCSRLGYTGEDGFEISIPHEFVEDITEELLKDDRVSLAGLAPRDTLRLESGLCLMGQDMNKDITPIEANLSWTIGKRRKKEANFPGAKIILDQLKNGVEKKRMGFYLNTKSAARTHYKIYSDKNKQNEIGEVTSGSLSPMLNKAIGMCYVPKKYFQEFENGNEVKLYVGIRKRVQELYLTKMPFYKQNYYQKPKKSKK